MHRTPLFGIALPACVALAVLSLGPGCNSTHVTEVIDDEEPPILTPGTVDMQVVASRTESTLVFEDRNFDPAECAVVEGWIGGSGVRRLLKFDSLIANMGAVQLLLGDPASPEPPFDASDFEFSACYGTYVFEDYAEFELRDSGGMTVGAGHKQACCVVDSMRIAGAQSAHFNDCAYQGLTSGWADLYPSDLDGQWVDVTGVPEGDYTLVVRANPTGRIPETPNTYANEVSISVHVPDPSQPPP